MVLRECRKQEMVPRKRCKKMLQGTTVLRVPRVPTTQEYFYKVENCLRAIYFTTRNLSPQFPATGKSMQHILERGLQYCSALERERRESVLFFEGLVDGLRECLRGTGVLNPPCL